MNTGRRSAPAVARNRDAILAVLRQVLPGEGVVLEVASGTGEHAAHFAAALPGLLWQPSDPDPLACASIAGWTAEVANVAPPLAMDAASGKWPIAAADAVVCINMAHISPWAATEGLIAGAARLLPMGAPLILYGPYFRAGVETAPSNLAFDADLRSRDPRWGLRDLDAVIALADAAGLRWERTVDMPANNVTVVLRRR